jgi:hypothetical protein
VPAVVGGSPWAEYHRGKDYRDGLYPRSKACSVDNRAADPSEPRLRKMFKASNRQRSPSGLVTGSTAAPGIRVKVFMK